PAWDGRPWADDLPADDRPAADLVALARVLTGQRIDDSGGLARLAAADLRESWAKLRDAYPADFTAPKGEAAAWHEAQAAANEPERRPVQAAILKLSAGDAAGYRRACAELLAKTGPTPDGPAARWVAWVCCLTPDAVVDPKAVMMLAERALAAAPRQPAALA